MDGPATGRGLEELVRGIHPAVLTERGLEAAIVALVQRAPVPVALDVRAAGAARRLLDRVQAVGGTLDVSSPPGQGTRLSVRLPAKVLGSLSGH